jgi:hypothetical protein
VQTGGCNFVVRRTTKLHQINSSARRERAPLIALPARPARPAAFFFRPPLPCLRSRSLLRRALSGGPVPQMAGVHAGHDEVPARDASYGHGTAIALMRTGANGGLSVSNLDGALA